MLRPPTRPSSSRTSAQVLLSLEHSIHVHSDVSEVLIRVSTVSAEGWPSDSTTPLADPEDALSASTRSRSEASTCRAINPCFLSSISDSYLERTLSFPISDSILFRHSALCDKDWCSSPRLSAAHLGQPLV